MMAGFAGNSRRAEPNGSRGRVWWRAFALAATLHLAGLGFAAVRTVEIEDDFADGAAAVEFSVELSAPSRLETDAPPGPEAMDNAAAPAMTETAARPQEVTDPPEKPSEVEDSERTVTEQPPAKQVETEERTSRIETVASTEQAASQASAPPPVDGARETAVRSAPVQGSGASATRLRTSWQKQLLAHLDRNKRYPAGRSGRTTEVLLAFTLDRAGRVLDARIMRTSGDEAFDAAALAMIRRADPAPAPPPAVADEGLSFTVPVQFRTKADVRPQR